MPLILGGYFLFFKIILVFVYCEIDTELPSGEMPRLPTTVMTRRALAPVDGTVACRQRHSSGWRATIPSTPSARVRPSPLPSTLFPLQVDERSAPGPADGHTSRRVRGGRVEFREEEVFHPSRFTRDRKFSVGLGSRISTTQPARGGGSLFANSSNTVGVSGHCQPYHCFRINLVS